MNSRGRFLQTGENLLIFFFMFHSLMLFPFVWKSDEPGPQHIARVSTGIFSPLLKRHKNWLHYVINKIFCISNSVWILSLSKAGRRAWGRLHLPAARRSKWGSHPAQPCSNTHDSSSPVSEKIKNPLFAKEIPLVFLGHSLGLQSDQLKSLPKLTRSRLFKKLPWGVSGKETTVASRRCATQDWVQEGCSVL